MWPATLFYVVLESLTHIQAHRGWEEPNFFTRLNQWLLTETGKAENWLINKWRGQYEGKVWYKSNKGFHSKLLPEGGVRVICKSETHAFRLFHASALSHTESPRSYPLYFNKISLHISWYFVTRIYVTCHMYTNIILVSGIKKIQSYLTIKKDVHVFYTG